MCKYNFCKCREIYFSVNREIYLYHGRANLIRPYTKWEKLSVDQTDNINFKSPSILTLLYHGLRRGELNSPCFNQYLFFFILPFPIIIHLIDLQKQLLYHRKKLTKKNNLRNNLIYLYVNLNYEHETHFES